MFLNTPIDGGIGALMPDMNYVTKAIHISDSVNLYYTFVYSSKFISHVQTYLFPNIT